MGLAVTDMTVCLRNHHKLSRGGKTQNLWWQQWRPYSGFCWHTAQSQSIHLILHLPTRITSQYSNWDISSQSETRGFEYESSKKTKLTNSGQAQNVYLLEHLHSEQTVSWARNEEVWWDLHRQHLKTKIEEKHFPERY